MMIGNRNEFAIEYNLNENFGGAWLFGKICYWVNGESVGDFELGTSLRDVFIQMHPLLKDAGNRSLGVDNNFTPAEIFYEIDNSLYGSGKDREAVGVVLDSPGRFDIRVPVDVFDEWKIYLFEQGGSDFILYKNISLSGVRYVELREGVFDSVMASFYAELNELYEKEGGSN